MLIVPFEIPGASRMSVIPDPSGAEVQLWQPKGHIGAGIVNEVGTWTLNELVTPDLDAAKAFYRDLFGWTAEDVPGALPRASFALGDMLIGGAHAPTEAEAGPARWTVSFRVADADADVPDPSRLVKLPRSEGLPQADQVSLGVLEVGVGSHAGHLGPRRHRTPALGFDLLQGLID